MAALQALLVLLWVGVAVVTACPSQCRCGPYKNRPSQTDLYVDCSGGGLYTIPTNLPEHTKSLNMANNKLTTINRSALALLNLEEINLSENNIQEVPRRSISVKGRCTFKDLDQSMNYQQRVIGGEWNIHGFMDVSWPCAIDLRNNPVSRIEEEAFSGSHNFTILLGQSSSNLTIETSAFRNTTNIIGLHISTVPALTLSVGSFLSMYGVYWIIIDKTEMRMNEKLFSGNSTRLRWFRISNSNILELRSDVLDVPMDVKTNCFVKSYPYPNDGSGLTQAFMSNMDKGGVEIINNTLPILPANLFGRSNLGGVYFKDNKIDGFRAGVFARKPQYNYTDICIIRFADNELPSIPSGAFRALRNVNSISIYGGNFRSIEANAFADSSNIGRLSIDISSNHKYKQVIVKSKAFARIDGVKNFIIAGANHGEEKGTARLLVQPRAFDSLNNVDYMTAGLYANMDQLPNDLFTGLTVNQRFELRATDLTRISPTAFGRNSTGTNINRLVISDIQSIPCDCETSKLNRNLKDTVGDVVGLTCAFPSDSGTIYHTTKLDAACSACTLRFSLELISVISVFLNL